MSETIPKICPACALALLNRAEWFPNPETLQKARLAYATGIPRLLSSEFFAKAKISAITLGTTVYFRIEELYEPHTPKGLALLAHEFKHVEQYLNRKLVKFYSKYVWDYLQHSYGKNISFEAEAYTFEKAVLKQLKAEFEHNKPRTPCIEMGEPHSPNPEFVKLPTTPFVFP
jgi:hypothetical protein